MALAFNRFDSAARMTPMVRAAAEVGPYELAFAMQKRGLRASWGAIAAMLGVSEDALRRAADPTYATDRPRAASEDHGPKPGLTRRVAAALAAGPKSLAQLREELDVDADAVLSAMDSLRRRLRVVYVGPEKRRGAWALTPEGETWGATRCPSTPSLSVRDGGPGRGSGERRSRLLRALVERPLTSRAVALALDCDSAWVGQAMWKAFEAGLVEYAGVGRRGSPWRLTAKGRAQVGGTVADAG